VTSIYGIGQVRAKTIAEKGECGSHEKDPRTHEDEVNRIRTSSSRKGAWKAIFAKNQMNIRRLIKIRPTAAIPSPPQPAGFTASAQHTNARTARVHAAGRLPVRSRSGKKG